MGRFLDEAGQALDAVIAGGADEMASALFTGNAYMGGPEIQAPDIGGGEIAPMDMGASGIEPMGGMEPMPAEFVSDTPMIEAPTIDMGMEL